MKNLQKLEVGKPAPIRVPSTEGISPAIVGASLDVWGFLANLTSEEVKAWRKGKMAYSLFCQDDIPILIIDVRGLATFDLPVNFLLEPEDKRREFLESEPEANLVTFVLCDWPEGNVRAIRAVGLRPEIIQAIKEACFNQVSRYRSASEVANEIAGIQRRYSLEEMIRLSPLTRL